MHPSPRLPPVCVGEFFRHQYLSAAGFDPWEHLTLASAWRQRDFAGRMLRAHVLHPAPLYALLHDARALEVVREVLWEPDVARTARLGPTGALGEEIRDRTGPGYVVASGPPIDRGWSIDDLAMAVEGFDVAYMLAPACQDAIARLRPILDRDAGCFRLATNQFHLNHMSLHLRLVTLGYLDVTDPANL